MLLLEAAKIFRRKFHKNQTTTAAAIENVLGECLIELRRYDEAEALLTTSYKTTYDYKGSTTNLAALNLNKKV